VSAATRPASEASGAASDSTAAVEASRRPSERDQEAWRCVDLGAVDAFTNNAQMAVLARSTADSGRPILQTSVWGRTHLNVGWFDDVDDTLDLERCAELGVQVIRRPFAGGGTAFYDAGCALMWGVLFPKGAGHDDLDAEIARVKPIVIDALERIGLGDVTFRGSADLRWERDRKLGGVSSGDFGKVVSVGGFLNIRPPNMDLYLQVVRVPDEKFKDKLVSDMREVVCTAQEVAGRDVSYEEFRDALFASVRAAGIDLINEPLTEVEQGALAKISQRIASDDSVRRISSDRFRAEAPVGTRVGLANHKGKKLCRAGVAIDASGTIVAAMMAGDMHVAPPDTLDQVAVALVGAPASDPDALRARIGGVWEAPAVHQADATMGVTTDDLLTAVTKAAAAAQGTTS
jgi:lipoate-protein ligase A